MSIYNASTTTRTFPRFGKGFAAAAAGGALVLAAVAGIGIRQATQEDSTGGTVTTTRQADSVAVSDQEAYQVWQRRTVAGEERIDTMGGVAGWRAMQEDTASSGSAAVTSTAKPVVRPAADTTMTVYLTGSAEATARIQADIVEENSIRHQLGEAPLQEMVLTGDSDDATLFLRDLQYQADAATLRVVDMRVRPASVGSAGSAGQDLPLRDTPHFTP